ncbi:MAG TPA: glycosyltransferase family 2 protein [Anaerolineae bacterium]|jgi:glycosyltransferase involved in cell wall biosynthesis
MSRTLVILTLNEIDGVQALLPALPREEADEVLAVDGGSTDGTREFLQAQGIPIYGQDKRGRGEAFRVGVANSTGEHIVFFSPDGNEDPADIPKLFELLEAGADMAIASRFLPGAQNEEDDEVLPLRKWANQGFTILANLIWNRGRPWISDTINGFRGIRRQAFERLAPKSLGYTIEYELTIGAMREGMQIVEKPTCEEKRIGGETKGASWPTGQAFLKFFLGEVRRDVEANAYFWPYLALLLIMFLVGWGLLRSGQQR